VPHNALLSKSKHKTASFQNRNLTIRQAKMVVTLQSGYKSINAVPSWQTFLFWFSKR
jgi:hypothetical protein